MENCEVVAVNTQLESRIISDIVYHFKDVEGYIFRMDNSISSEETASGGERLMVSVDEVH